MTNLFIHPNNQELIWNALQNNQLLSFFSPDEAKMWFARMIEIAYKENPNVNTVEQLKKVNALVFKQMSHYLKEQKQYLLQQQQQQIQYKNNNQNQSHPSPQYNNQYTQNIVQEPVQQIYGQTKEQQTNDQFEKLKKQYELENQKPVMKSDHLFAEEQDTPIKNIDELIQKHREDMDFYNKTPINSSQLFTGEPSENNEIMVQSLKPVTGLSSIPEEKLMIEMAELRDMVSICMKGISSIQTSLSEINEYIKEKRT